MPGIQKLLRKSLQLQVCEKRGKFQIFSGRDLGFIRRNKRLTWFIESFRGHGNRAVRKKVLALRL